MNDIKKNLQQKLEEILNKDYKEFTIVFEKPQNPDFGDLSCNVAMQLASKYKKNPRQLAEEIIEQIDIPNEISKVEVAGPGFINFTYSDPYLIEILNNPAQINPEKDQNQKIVIDYSSVNMAKPIGAHHLLSTVIGQAMANILRELGNEVISVNYIGDWGTQFGKLIYAYKTWGDKSKVEADPIPELLALYVKFHDEAEENPDLDDKGREEFRKLEEGDSENRELWRWIVDLSIEADKKTYASLGGISFDSWQGEAATEPNLKKLLEDGKKEKIFTLGEEDSYIVDLEKEGLPPYLVQKKDGATLYSTRDIETIRLRIQDYSPDEIMYVVDIAQKLHFEQLFASVRKFDWYNPQTKLTHLKFGRMSFKDKSMSTRKGNIIYLDEVLKDAIERAEQIINEKNPDLKDKKEVARIIGTGAVKYTILNQSPETDIIFDWDKILSFEGNSAPYLQYMHARAASILKEQTPPDQIDPAYNLHPKEALVLRTLTQFKDAITESATKNKPNILANYIYELSQIFSNFYTHCPVLKADTDSQKAARLKIVELFAHTLKKGLELLSGIEAPDQM